MRDTDRQNQQQRPETRHRRPTDQAGQSSGRCGRETLREPFLRAPWAVKGPPTTCPRPPRSAQHLRGVADRLRTTHSPTRPCCDQPHPRRSSVGVRAWGLRRIATHFTKRRFAHRDISPRPALGASAPLPAPVAHRGPVVGEEERAAQQLAVPCTAGHLQGCAPDPRFQSLQTSAAVRTSAVPAAQRIAEEVALGGRGLKQSPPPRTSSWQDERVWATPQCIKRSNRQSL